jgi:pyrroloquinoline-quinone synthase
MTVHRDDVRAALGAAVADRRLLTHPFYRRWEAGTLSRAELAEYAEQYRHLEHALPGVLARVVIGAPDGTVRGMAEATLDDELTNPAPHVALFEDFAVAVGARAACDPTDATAALMALQEDSAHRGTLQGIACMSAYEVQAAEVAASKAEGLRQHYGIHAEGTRFWDVHAGMELAHADWSTAALADLAEGPDDLALIEQTASAAAEAWWSFLDEREAAAQPVGAPC